MINYQTDVKTVNIFDNPHNTCHCQYKNCYICNSSSIQIRDLLQIAMTVMEHFKGLYLLVQLKSKNYGYNNS